jgi:hypothetical protein
MRALRQLVWMAAALWAAIAAPAWAGPYDQPYGLIEGGMRMQTRRQEPAAISKIDGESPQKTRRSTVVAPGKHVIEVSFTSARATVGDDLQTLEVDVKPCKRYRIAAQYQSSTSGKWHPVVQAEEDIGECRKKFMQGASAK